jgi:membrane protein DedA with SNARE-associated domain
LLPLWSGAKRWWENCSKIGGPAAPEPSRPFTFTGCAIRRRCYTPAANVTHFLSSMKRSRWFWIICLLLLAGGLTYLALKFGVKQWLHSMFLTWFRWVHDTGFWGVVVLMAMESSIFPVPSELVVPPAAILAADGGLPALSWVVFAGTFGSWLGSAITYWVALWVGRPFVMRFGGYFFMPPEKVERAERFMHRYETGGIFFARLLPVIRHLISIPAGIIRMNFWKFSALTIVGSAIWCTVLAWLGGRVGAKLAAGDPGQLAALKAGSNDVDIEKFVSAVKHEALWILVAVAAVCVLYVLAMRVSAKKKEEEKQAEDQAKSK